GRGPWPQRPRAANGLPRSRSDFGSRCPSRALSCGDARRPSCLPCRAGLRAATRSQGFAMTRVGGPGFSPGFSVVEIRELLPVVPLAMAVALAVGACGHDDRRSDGAKSPLARGVMPAPNGPPQYIIADPAPNRRGMVLSLGAPALYGVVVDHARAIVG